MAQNYHVTHRADSSWRWLVPATPGLRQCTKPRLKPSALAAPWPKPVTVSSGFMTGITGFASPGVTATTRIRHPADTSKTGPPPHKGGGFCFATQGLPEKFTLAACRA